MYLQARIKLKIYVVVQKQLSEDGDDGHQVAN
jgi:hypothetical protein